MGMMMLNLFEAFSNNFCSFTSV